MSPQDRRVRRQREQWRTLATRQQPTVSPRTFGYFPSVRVRKTCYFSDTNMQHVEPSASTRRRVPSSIDAAVARRVQRAAPGTVFTPALFAKAGSRAAVDK